MTITVRVVNSYYGALTHQVAGPGKHQTFCGARVKHGFEEDYDAATLRDCRHYLCPRCFPLEASRR